MPCLALLLAYNHAAWAGWRHDGTGQQPDATPPVDLATARTCWHTPTERGGNASPVFWPAAQGSADPDLVCVTTEPTTLQCLNAATGEPVWSADHDLLPLLDPAHQAQAVAARAAGEAASNELPALQQAIGSLRRARRARPEDADLATALLQAEVRRDAMLAAIDQARPYRTIDDQELIGWASPTPAIVRSETGEETLVALFGHGVVAGYRHDGSRRFARYLGPPPGQMNGYHLGTATSVLAAEGLAIVGFQNLRALDPTTGEDVWTAGPWRDYGTPAIWPKARNGKVSLLATPDGRLLRADSGAVLATDLGELWYVGPYIDQDLLVFLGGKAADHTAAAGGAKAVAYELSWPDDLPQPVPRKLWSTTLDTRDIFYTAPLRGNDVLYSTTRSGELRGLESGGRQAALSGRPAAASSGVGLRKPASDRHGGLPRRCRRMGSPRSTIQPGATSVSASPFPAEHRATPLLQGKRAIFRSTDAVWCQELP